MAKKVKKHFNKKIISTTIFTLAVFIVSLVYYNISNNQLGKSPSNEVFPIYTNETAKYDLEVHFIDVGQGDATLIKTPDGKNILIDAGDNINKVTTDLVNYLKNQNVRTIDYLIATHSDSDHIGGMPEIFKKFKVKFALRPFIGSENTKTGKLSSVFNPDCNISCTTDNYADFLVSLNKERCNWAFINSACDIEINYDNLEGESLKLDFLSPISKVEDIYYEDFNNYSPIIKLEYLNTSFMFTGDAETLVEKEILEFYSKNDIDIDILKISHHGSDTASSYAFLSTVTPSFSVISCGKGNIYKHPKQSVINNLVTCGSVVLRTDCLGSIVFTVDNNGDLKYSYDYNNFDNILIGY